MKLHKGTKEKGEKEKQDSNDSYVKRLYYLLWD